MDNEYYVFDQIMMGNQNTYGKTFFEKRIPGKINLINENRVFKISKYALENYLKWTPHYSYNHFDKEIAAFMKLDVMIQKYIAFPLELDSIHYYKYVISCLYPTLFPYHMEKHVINCYEKILSGQILGFKKCFFTGDTGEHRARICLNYVLLHICPKQFSSTADMYYLFESSGGNKFLKQYKLFSAGRNLFEFPLDYLHYSLPEGKREVELYLCLRKTLESTKIQKCNQRL